MTTDTPSSRRPNILLITCDQYRFPRFSYGPNGGLAQGLKAILGFQSEVDGTNPYARFFPGLLRLRKNAVVLRNHTIASSACIPSRTAIYTGQYGTRTGVTQTDGLFKSGDSPAFPWLEPDGIPTLGSWMREAGYTTHYFGKWHVSNPQDHSLQRYGFDDWETSYPEPHGPLPNDLGTYRDVGFSDLACTFIRRKALGLDYDRLYASDATRDPGGDRPQPEDTKPWFAVASFTNPHDIATYPGVVAQALPASDASQSTKLPDSRTAKRTTQPIFGPLTIPGPEDVTPPPVAGTARIPLNPLGFPQDCAVAAPTQNESLADKPSCQHEYAYKMGLALAAKAGLSVAERAGGDPKEVTGLAVRAALQSCIPFRLADNPDLNCQLFLQLYGWLHSVVDTHIEAVLKTLEETGQADNTVVIFLTDHGEYGGAHGMMMEKWHTAYAEALHVPVVIRDPRLAASASESGQADGAILRQVNAVTSHIDILPTVLGLAGVDQAERMAIHDRLAARRPMPPLPGVDLTPLVIGEWPDDTVIEPDGCAREGVLFITDDEITAPLPATLDPHQRHAYESFDIYVETVDAVREGAHDKGPVSLMPGAVKQPNHIRCLRTAHYKLARYFDPAGQAPQEWELYDLLHDPNEATNLVEVAVTPPKVRSGVENQQAVQAEVDRLVSLLEKLERQVLQ
ncbi:MAG TPA: sulfatase-like hydrolase/transferase [Sphingomonas sp.]|nr:sulfatase-like hydrolase/transferase [Sphingomonas sp.]